MIEPAMRYHEQHDVKGDVERWDDACRTSTLIRPAWVGRVRLASSAPPFEAALAPLLGRSCPMVHGQASQGVQARVGVDHKAQAWTVPGRGFAWSE
jgi:hypothetical protein